jgi:hypothetical protein
MLSISTSMFLLLRIISTRSTQTHSGHKRPSSPEGA